MFLYNVSVIVGEDNQGGQGVILCIPKDTSSLKPWRATPFTPLKYAARKERGEILFIEQVLGFLLLRRDLENTWHFAMGHVQSFTHGWVAEVSESSRGRIVFDSEGALDRLLEEITARTINFP